jgi:hypothetical protein
MPKNGTCNADICATVAVANDLVKVAEVLRLYEQQQKSIKLLLSIRSVVCAVKLL